MYQLSLPYNLDTVFWDMTPCRFVYRCYHLGGTRCLHLQGNPQTNLRCWQQGMVPIHQSTQRTTSDECNLHQHPCESIKSRINFTLSHNNHKKFTHVPLLLHLHVAYFSTDGKEPSSKIPTSYAWFVAI